MLMAAAASQDDPPRKLRSVFSVILLITMSISYLVVAMGSSDEQFHDPDTSSLTS